MKREKQGESSLVLESSLQSYFYTELEEVNNKMAGKLPNETIFYSSLVMDKFGDSEKYYEIVEGKPKEKTLGVMLLESSQLSGIKKKNKLKDIGDTALLICGFFSESMNRKIINLDYYKDVGQSAYYQLNTIIPSFYDVPLFYQSLSTNFLQVTNVMGLVAEKTIGRNESIESSYLISNKKISA
jgi:hypothetical protein